MKRALIAVTVCGILAAGVARADLDEGDYAPDIEAKDWLNTNGQPISLHELRGMVVVLYFWVSWHSAGEALFPLINQVANHPGYGRKGGVYVIGVTKADRARVQETIEEARIFFPIALESNADEAYKITSFPRVVVIDPMGKVAYSGWPSKGGKELIEALDIIFKEDPPFRTHPVEAADAYRALDKAREYYRAGDIRRAYMEARKAYQHALAGDALKMECQNMLDLIEALGRDRVAEAMRLFRLEKYEECVVKLLEVIEKHRVTRAARLARHRLRDLKEHYPEVRRAAEAHERKLKANELLSEVGQLLWERAFGEAYDLLDRIKTEYSETPAADQAGKILKRMEQNKLIMGYIRDYQAERECNRLLTEARNYMATGRYDDARRVLRRIIQDYPGTVFVDEAYRMLAELP